MKQAIFSLALGSTLAFSLMGCATDTTTATLPRPPEVQAACRETGLTDSGDSKMGQRDCTPRPTASSPAAK